MLLWLITEKIPWSLCWSAIFINLCLAEAQSIHVCFHSLLLCHCNCNISVTLVQLREVTWGLISSAVLGSFLSLTWHLQNDQMLAQQNYVNICEYQHLSWYWCQYLSVNENDCNILYILHQWMVFMLSTYPYCETAHYSVLFGQQHKHYQPLPNMCGFQCHPLGVLLWAKNNECREKNTSYENPNGSGNF